jgi:ABC-type Fe3+/spermidine/putrescine transport system ATPase subunit
MSAIILDHLNKTFSAEHTVGPVSLDIREGELLSLLGPSGCGKTTILRMIAGFMTPTGGSIHLRGRDITTLPAHRRGVALVFQNFALFPHLSVFDNIAFGLRRRGIAREEIAQRVGNAMAIVQLGGFEKRLPQALSGGQQQRVALARALVIEPAVILLDEPFSSLDTKLRESTRLELRALQQQLGFTAVLVTHDQSEALSISDRIVVMEKGKLAQVGTAADIYYKPTSPFVAEFIGRANRVPEGIVRPESIQLRPLDATEGEKAVVTSGVFLGAGSELGVRTAGGLDLVVAADGTALARHPLGSEVKVFWPTDSIIRFGDNT